MFFSVHNNMQVLLGYVKQRSEILHLKQQMETPVTILFVFNHKRQEPILCLLAKVWLAKNGKLRLNLNFIKFY